MYKSLLKPVLFLLPPERAHNLVFGVLTFLSKLPGFNRLTSALFTVKDPILNTRVFGLDFPNPVGLAAGFDKDAVLYDTLFSFGFGFIEIGTTTPLPQIGNPMPRMFRLPMDGALINRMGFNNKGLDYAVQRLKNRDLSQIVGGNIGKNKSTPNNKAIDDYEKLFHGLYPQVNYFVVNVSSPNTPNLRELQEKAPLKALLTRLKELREGEKVKKPILLKIAPDLNNSQLDDIVEIVLETGIDGLIATNTTIDRGRLRTSAERVSNIGAGGLSGEPLKNRSNEVIAYIKRKSNGSIPVIGVGGVKTAADAIEKFEAGASLVQVYTGFIYEGPAMIKRINKGLIDYFRSKEKSVSEIK